MKTINKRVLIWYSAQEMFSLVADVRQYPNFLPWCDHATVHEQHDDGVTAEIGIAMGGLRQTFITRNQHLAGPRIVMSMLDGPFSSLDGEWSFSSLAGPGGTSAPKACRVGLSLRYGFSNSGLAKVVGPVFDRISDSLVDAFVKRAEQVYG